MFSGDSRWHTNCIKHTIFHPRGNLKTAVWVNCWKSVTSWSNSTPCMDYWTLIRGLLMEARAGISPHSFPVTHAEIQLVSSQTITINLDCTCWQHPAGEWQSLFIHLLLMQKSTASQWKLSQLTLLKNWLQMIRWRRETAWCLTHSTQTCRHVHIFRFLWIDYALGLWNIRGKRMTTS